MDGTDKSRRTDSSRGSMRKKSKRYSNDIKKAEKLKKKDEKDEEEAEALQETSHFWLLLQFQ